MQRLLPEAETAVSYGGTDQAFFQAIGAETVIYGPDDFDLSCPFEVADDRTDVVTVYGARVLQAKVGEHPLRRENVLDPGLEHYEIGRASCRERV